MDSASSGGAKMATVAGVEGEDPLDAQLNVYNVAAMLARPRARYEFLRIDPNNTCNVQCVYCHNHRSAVIVPTEEILAFLAERVITPGCRSCSCARASTQPWPADCRNSSVIVQRSISRTGPVF
jgi:hypothetical protein